VRKTGAKERNGDSGGGEDEDEERNRMDRREGRGRGKQVRDGRGGGRRDAREVAGAAAVEDGGVAEGKGTKGKGRGQKGGRKGSQEAGRVEEMENISGDEVSDELSGSASLNLLKLNSQKIIRFTKGELLSIARLPASNMKPPDLDPLVDKSNKESQLVTRMAGGHGEDPEAAREKRRERRNERRNVERPEGSGGEEECVGRAESEAVAPPAVASSQPLPKSRIQPPAASGLQPSSTETAVPSKPTAPSPEGDVDHATSRAFDKLLDRKKFEQASLVAGEASSQPSTSQDHAASLLQQQTAVGQQPLSQAQVLQAAAYLQVMSMNAAAAAARGYPASLPWGYNPYLFPYGNPDVASAYPGTAGALAGASALGANGGYGKAAESRRDGGTAAVAAAKAAASFPMRPAQPRAGSAAASLPASKRASPPLEVGAQRTSDGGGETSSFLLPAADADSKVEEEDEAGCSQS